MNTDVDTAKEEGRLENHETLLELKGITKTYPGVVALRNVNFSVRKNEVHALCGENGAGKSTLIKIISGSIERDEGTIIFDGKEYTSYSTQGAIDMGISVIYQEFNLIKSLSVQQNIFLGKAITKGIFLDKKAMYKLTKELFRSLEIEIDPNKTIDSLSVAYQQLTEIAKAIVNKAKLIIMDEPSATLTNKELEILFKLIRKLKAEGTSIVYVSHRLEEVFEIADRVTVFRDGEYINTKNTADTDKEDLIKMIVGRSISSTFPRNIYRKDEVVLEVKNLTNDKVKNASLTLHSGEILGITGLVGAGRTELVRMIFGADDYIGEIWINGKLVKIKSPMDAIKNEISFLPEDRKTQGLLLEMGVDYNMAFASVKKWAKNGFVVRKKQQEMVKKFIKMLDIKTPSIGQKIKFLSGGNQQKVIIAKWLACDSKIIIFDEPTRGIDVGTKHEIYMLMNALLAQGKSIIMVSSELPELIGMSDRAIVMHEGRIVGELNKDELDQERIITLASTKERINHEEVC